MRTYFSWPAKAPLVRIVDEPDARWGEWSVQRATAQVINAMWSNAQSRADTGLDLAKSAVDLPDAAPQMGVHGIFEQAPKIPLPPELDNPDPDEGKKIYEEQFNRMCDMITDGFSDYIGTHFPDTGWFEEALDWCHKAIRDGGTGINPAVEAQLWARDRARIQRKAQEDKAQATSEWAGKRFPMPPGAMYAQVNQIDQEASFKMSEQSRDIAIKSFETEIENVRFAAKELLDLRVKALDAGLNYIRTLMLAPETAMKLATGLSGLQYEFMRSLTAMYTAQVSALEPQIRMIITDAELRQKSDQANLNAKMASIDAKVKAAMAAAQLVGTQSAAGINAIGARLSRSGSSTYNHNY